MIRKNIYWIKKYDIIVSAIAYFGCFIKQDYTIFPSILIVAGCLFLLRQKLPEWKDLWNAISIRGEVFSVLSAFGIILGARDSFLYFWGVNTKTLIMTTAGAVAGFYFVLYFVALFFKRFEKVFSEWDLLNNSSKQESVICGTLLIVLISITTVIFVQTDAFYGTKYYYDIVYTSDSPYLVKSNVYMDINNHENDIRQPLFAIFAAPLLGIPNLLSVIFGNSLLSRAIVLNGGQIVILFVGNYILAKSLNLSPIKRISFILLSCLW